MSLEKKHVQRASRAGGGGGGAPRNAHHLESTVGLGTLSKDPLREYKGHIGSMLREPLRSTS